MGFLGGGGNGVASWGVLDGGGEESGDLSDAWGRWSCRMAAEARNLERRCVGLCFSMHHISLGLLIHQSISPTRWVVCGAPCLV